MGIHDITTAPVGAPVRIELDGAVVAESDAAVVLEEQGLPARYYLPRADIGAELLPSDSNSHCPWKGDASYHSVGVHRDIAWFYPEPKQRVAAIRDHVAFYNDKVELFVGGEPV
ncbi:MAG: DUF427 domain-containing protein [Solirubrobacteraceae bacterium]